MPKLKHGDLGFGGGKWQILPLQTGRLVAWSPANQLLTKRGLPISYRMPVELRRPREKANHTGKHLTPAMAEPLPGRIGLLTQFNGKTPLCT
jgi:hypothetical protein